jgi:hypothetical protein
MMMMIIISGGGGSFASERISPHQADRTPLASQHLYQN